MLALWPLLLVLFQDTPTLSSEGTLDRTGEGLAFLEVSAERTEVFVQEPLLLRLRFGVEEEFLARQVIQLFRRDLSLPVQLQADWLEELPGAAWLPAEAGPSGATGGATSGATSGAIGATSFALGGAVLEAGPATSVERDGRRYRVLELERRYEPLAAGELRVPPAFLRFAYATSFREDFVSGRVPADRVDAYVVSAALEIRVRELPLAGQPPDFRGAIGNFSIETEAAPRDLVLGERLQLVLTIEGLGESNLQRFEPPVLNGLRDLSVLGRVDELTAGVRRVTYDLEPRGTRVREVPPISLSFFDPAAGAYRTIESRPIPILVRSLTDSGDPPAATEPAPVASTGPSALVLFAVAAAVAALIAVLVLRVRRRGQRSGTSALLARARVAAVTFRERTAQAQVDPAEPFDEFLAALLECPPAAVVSANLAHRLHAAGVAADAAQRAALLHDGLFAPRYGGPAPQEGRAAALELVEELSRA